MSDISRLNRKRDFGIIYGDPNIRYFQDGHSYGHDDKLYVAAGGEPPVPPPHEGTQVAKTVLETEDPVMIEEQDPETLEALEEQRNRARSEAMQRYWEEKRAQKAQK